MKKKFNSNNALLLFLGLFDQKHYGFDILEHFFGPLYHACTLREIFLKYKALSRLFARLCLVSRLLATTIK